MKHPKSKTIFLSVLLLTLISCTSPTHSQEKDNRHPIESFVSVPIFVNGKCTATRYIPRQKPNEVSFQFSTLMSSQAEMKDAAVSEEALAQYKKFLVAAATKYLRQIHVNSVTDFSVICKVVPSKPTEFWTIVGPATPAQSQQIVKGLVAALNSVENIHAMSHFEFLIVISVPPSAPNP